jgi:hypothetical protein
MKKIIDFLIDLPENIIENIRRKILAEWGFDPFSKKDLPIFC